jgi:O-antigen ligase
MVGCVLMIPAVLGAMSLVRERAARLGLLGGVLMIAGYVCYFGLCLQSYATIAMAEHGGATSDHVALLNATMNQAFFVVPALVFVAGTSSAPFCSVSPRSAPT